MLLPNFMPHEEINDPQTLFADDDYCAEEMLDGQRLLVSKHGCAIRGFSCDRMGHTLPLAVVDLARSSSGNFVLDGERVGESFIAFDILDVGGVNVCSEPFALRRKLLEHISPFPIVAHATGEPNKTTLLQMVWAACGVGIVFKRLDATYSPEQHLFGVKCQHYRSRIPRVNEVPIEICSLGMQRGGNPPCSQLPRQRN